MADRQNNRTEEVPFGLEKFTDDALDDLSASGEENHPLGSALAFEIEVAVGSVSELVSQGSIELDINQLEQDLRAIWHRAIQLAKHFLTAPPYYVIWQLQAAHARGDLPVRVGGGGAAATPIRFRNGERLWTDLPFCAESLIHAVSQDELVITHPQQRGNILGFVGQLFGSGTGGGRFDVVVLYFLRYLLEEPWTPERITRPAAVPDDQVQCCIYYSQPGEHPFLSLLGRMLLYAAPRLAALSNRSAQCPMGVTIMAGGGGGGTTGVIDTGLGKLAQQAGLEATEGFSPERWNFWAHRLQSVMGQSAESPNYHPSDIKDILWTMRKASLEAGGPCLALTTWIGTPPTEA